MKSKIIILLFSLIILTGSVNAITEGQILTQAQLDNFNLNDINAQFLDCHYNGRSFTPIYVIEDIDCLEPRQNSETDYIIVRADRELRQPILPIITAVERGIPFGTIAEVYLRTQRERFQTYLTDIGLWVEDYQTRQYDSSDVQRWFRNNDLF